MIAPNHLVNELERVGVQFFTGVPDSLLKSFCACVQSTRNSNLHQIAANEGSAMGLAIGYHLATGRIPAVYFQNSGLGNAWNPLSSLASPLVYSIPLVLIVGWRGELLPDGTQDRDEPQHVHQGRITIPQLELLNIPVWTLGPADDAASSSAKVAEAVTAARQDSRPVALVFRKGTFESFPHKESETGGATPPPLSREESIRLAVEALPVTAAVVATTGMSSRELYEIRAGKGHGHHRDFLTVGGMGHALQIAVGLARFQPERTVVCLDGDGALLMHTGGMSLSACTGNLFHIVLNNRAHDSVGGQPTPLGKIELTRVASAFGYEHIGFAESAPEVQTLVTNMLLQTGSRFLEIRCRKGARADLGRPKDRPSDNKQKFMDFLSLSALEASTPTR